MNYYRSQEGSPQIARLNSNSLRKARGGSVINITKHGQEGVSSRPMTGTSADAAPVLSKNTNELKTGAPGRRRVSSIIMMESATIKELATRWV